MNQSSWSLSFTPFLPFDRNGWAGIRKETPLSDSKPIHPSIHRRQWLVESLEVSCWTFLEGTLLTSEIWRKRMEKEWKERFLENVPIVIKHFLLTSAWWNTSAYTRARNRSHVTFAESLFRIRALSSHTRGFIWLMKTGKSSCRFSVTRAENAFQGKPT